MNELMREVFEEAILAVRERRTLDESLDELHALKRATGINVGRSFAFPKNGRLLSDDPN